MKKLLDFIFENTVVGFKKKTPTYGECIILAGGPGSGKGFIKNIIDADFKTYDVDDLKGKYIKLLNQGKLKDELKNFDFKNPEDVTELHMRVKDHGWKDKQINLIFRNKQNPNKEANNSKILPNLLFDRVSGKIEDITEIATRAKTLGYNVTLVWVLCNLEVAKINNRVRDRYVDEEKVLIPNHKAAYKTLTDLLNNKYPYFNDYIDTAWIGYSAGYGRIQGGKYKTSPVIKVKKDSEGKFIFDQEKMVDSFLKEKQPIDLPRIKKDLSGKNGEKMKNQAEMFIKIDDDAKEIEYKKTGTD
jgi:hypothetical protein